MQLTTTAATECKVILEIRGARCVFVVAYGGEKLYNNVIEYLKVFLWYHRWHIHHSTQFLWSHRYAAQKGNDYCLQIVSYITFITINCFLEQYFIVGVQGCYKCIQIYMQNEHLTYCLLQHNLCFHFVDYKLTWKTEIEISLFHIVHESKTKK